MKKKIGGFVPPPFIMAKFAQNAAALVPASLIAGLRLFQNNKTNKKHKVSKRTIFSSRKRKNTNKRKKSATKHRK